MGSQPLQVAGTGGIACPNRRVQRNGFAGLTSFDYGGKYLGYSGRFDHISEHFRNTDLGFLNGRV
jgi:hypothetical protein